jgi:hypothetical protein
MLMSVCRKTPAASVRAREDGGDQVPHHGAAAALLRHRELRGCQAEDDVSQRALHDL